MLKKVMNSLILLLILTLDIYSQTVFVDHAPLLEYGEDVAKHLEFKNYREQRYKLFLHGGLDLKDIDFFYNNKPVMADSITSKLKYSFYRDFYGYYPIESDAYLTENLKFDDSKNEFTLISVDTTYLKNDTLIIYPYFEVNLFYKNKKYKFEYGNYDDADMEYPIVIKAFTNILHKDAFYYYRDNSLFSPFTDLVIIHTPSDNNKVFKQ